MTTYEYSWEDWDGAIEAGREGWRVIHVDMRVVQRDGWHEKETRYLMERATKSTTPAES
jgi:N-acetyl-beta-hexosaminidase